MNATSNRLIVAMLVVAALAAGFWILILSPKREEASNLSAEVDQLRGTLVAAQAQAAEAVAARQEFPEDYRKLVVLGKAVPGDDEFSSLLVALNRVAENAGAEFESIALTSGGGEAPAASAGIAQEAGPSMRVDETVPPTEAAAALMPLGSSIGPAGLAVMPYDLTFSGTYFSIAKFIEGIDSMVMTTPDGTRVDGRLVTLDSFVLNPEEAGEGESAANTKLTAAFSVTTYLAPPSEGITAGATEAAPATAEAAPEEAATGTPSSFSTPANEEAQ
jgi:Tfp pilus assembly protein PilO